MERESVKYLGDHDNEERLIIFSSLDLDLDLEDSSIGFYSDDDDDNLDKEETGSYIEIVLDDDDNIDKEETGSYTEVALDEPSALSILPQLCNQQREREGEAKSKSKSKEKSITGFPSSSFSPLVSTFPGFPSSSSPTLYSSTNTNTTTTSSSSSECGAATAADGYAIKSRGSSPVGRSKFSLIPSISSTNNYGRKKQFSAFHRLLNTLLSAFGRPSSSLEITKKSSRPDHDDDCNKKMALNTTNSWNIVWNRKPSTPLMTVERNGVIVKLFIKFKSMTIGSVVTSFFKPQRGVNSPGGNNTSQQNKGGPSKMRLMKNYRRRLMKPFDRWTSAKPRSRQQDQSNFKGSSSSSSMDKYSLDETKGMFDPLNVMKIRSRKGKQMSKSCPNTFKSSPLLGGKILVPSEARNMYTRDNSIQAAIAHCKSSFGQTYH